jgi:hypothetical protein
VPGIASSVPATRRTENAAVVALDVGGMICNSLQRSSFPRRCHPDEVIAAARAGRVAS